MTTAFILMGQSNFLGPVPNAISPVIPADTIYCAQRTSRALRSAHVSMTGTGPASPLGHLLLRWRELTGEAPVGLITNVGGSSILPAANGGPGFWQVDTEGSLFDQAALWTDRLFEGVALSPRLRITRVIDCWCQGEQDATMANGTTVTAALYREGLQAIFERRRDMMASRGYVGDAYRFAVWQTGYRTTDPDSLAWAAIRQAQADFVTEHAPTTLMAWDKANERGPLVVDGAGDWISGWGYPEGDPVHWDAPSQRASGRGGAANLAAAEGLI